MQFVENDGGRHLAGFRGLAGDCVCRSVAIAAGLPYADVYNRLAHEMKNMRRPCRTRSPRNGVPVRRVWFKRYMTNLGFEWVPTMHIGQGCRVHLRQGELPPGRLVVQVSKHLTAVIDGVVHDTHNPCRDGMRCVYGYWVFKGAGNGI